MNREIGFKEVTKNKNKMFEIQIGGTRVVLNRTEAEMLSVVLNAHSYEIFGMQF